MTTLLIYPDRVEASDEQAWRDMLSGAAPVGVEIMRLFDGDDLQAEWLSAGALYVRNATLNGLDPYPPEPTPDPLPE